MYKIGAIVLAAGLSSRMGKPKLFLPFLNVPLIQYPVTLAIRQKLDPVLVVGGKYIHELQEELNLYSEQMQIIHNWDYEKGMSTSLIAGINALNEEVDGVLIFLGDQPLVSDKVVEKLILTYEENMGQGTKIVRPRYADQPGHPIIFDKSLFSDFQTLSGDEGGKSIIKANGDKLIYVDFENEKLNLDIDTPQDYDALLETLSELKECEKHDH